MQYEHCIEHSLRDVSQEGTSVTCIIIMSVISFRTVTETIFND